MPELKVRKKIAKWDILSLGKYKFFSSPRFLLLPYNIFQTQDKHGLYHKLYQYCPQMLLWPQWLHVSSLGYMLKLWARAWEWPTLHYRFWSSGDQLFSAAEDSWSEACTHDTILIYSLWFGGLEFGYGMGHSCIPFAGYWMDIYVQKNKKWDSFLATIVSQISPINNLRSP